LILLSYNYATTIRTIWRISGETKKRDKQLGKITVPYAEND
jgi:hypothetical protein